MPFGFTVTMMVILMVIVLVVIVIGSTKAQRAETTISVGPAGTFSSTKLPLVSVVALGPPQGRATVRPDNGLPLGSVSVPTTVPSLFAGCNTPRKNLEGSSGVRLNTEPT